MTTAHRAASISEAFPGHELWSGLEPGTLHLNHGSFGAVARPVRDAQAALRAEIDRNPTRFFRRELAGRLHAARVAAAEYLKAPQEGFTLVRNVTEGVSVALAGFPLREGDEVLLTDHAYPAVRIAVRVFAERAGAVVKEVALPFDDEAVAGAVADAFTPATRLLVVDHIAAAAGRVLPIGAIVAAAREAGVATLVDAAHAPGSAPVDVAALGCDIWTGNFHKWLCAPQGAGGLWVAPELRERMRPLVVSHWWDEPYPDALLRFGTDDVSAQLCVPDALRVLSEIDPHWALISRNRALAAHAREVMAEALHSAPAEGEFAAMAAVLLPPDVASTDEGAVALQSRIAEALGAEVSVNRVAGRAVIRMSCFVYNRAEEYELLAERLPAALR